MKNSHNKRVATRLVGFASAILLVINTLVSSYFLYSLPQARAQEELPILSETIVEEVVVVIDEGICELVVTKTDNDVETVPGGEVTYHLTVQNTGDGTCEDGLHLKDFFDGDETSFVSASPTATDEPDPDHDRVAWLVGVLEPGQMFEADLTMQVLENIECPTTVSNYAMWWFSTENYGGEAPQDTPVNCEEEEETSPAPWCSVLYGIFESAYTEPMTYDDPSDINDDEGLSVSDFAMLGEMYGNNDNPACYLEFDGFDETNYLEIDWCAGIERGFEDEKYFNVSIGDPYYFEPFDINNDGSVTVEDWAEFAGLNQQACYCQFTDYFPGYGCQQDPPEDLYCGDGEINNDEQCDDSNNQDGDGCSANCSLEDTYLCEDITSQDGWFGQYYNYSREHTDMNLDSSEWPDATHGDPLGAWSADWYDSEYFRFNRVDSDLSFGEDFFPMDMAMEETDNGHDYHFGVHWRAEVTPPAPGSYNFSLTSDDDAWVYLDGVLVADNSGIHAPSTLNGSIALSGAPQIVDIFFAERHVTQSHLNFSFEDESLDIVPMPEDCGNSITICKYDIQGVPLSGWEMSIYGNNLVVNGDFEYPVVTANSGQWELFNSAAVDWNVSWVANQAVNLGLLEFQTTLLGTPFSGGQYAELDSNFPTIISQDIMTVPGVNYELGFAFSPRVGRDLFDNQLGVQFGAVSDTLGADGTANSDTVWTYHVYDFQAVGTTTYLSFTDLGTPNSFGTFVDDVTVRSKTTGTTGENGCVVFTDLPYGTYEIWETMQDGWTQIEPVEGDYYTVVLTSDDPHQTVTFVNEYDEENPPEEPENPPTGGGGYSGSGSGQNAYCGDGKVNRSAEQCDDGNTANGDGCSFQCLTEEVLGEKIIDDQTSSESASEAPKGVLGYTELPATGGVDNNFTQLLSLGIISLYGASLLKTRFHKV